MWWAQQSATTPAEEKQKERGLEERENELTPEHSSVIQRDIWTRVEQNDDILERKM